MTDQPASTQIVCSKCNALNRIRADKPTVAAKCGKCGTALFDAKPVELNDTNFARHISRNDIPVVVDFWADWCGPCKMMAPEFAKAAKVLEPDFRLAKLNTETARDVATRYAIQSIPMLMIFKNGEILARQPGAMSASQIEKWVRENG